jgi:hypothetical protein
LPCRRKGERRVSEEFDELGDGRDVDLLHLSLHHPRGERGEAWDRTDPGRHVHAGVADRGDLDLLEAILADRVEAEEGEEEVGLDSLHAGAVGHDERGIDPFERALGDDDRDLLDRRWLGRGSLRMFEQLCHLSAPS